MSFNRKEYAQGYRDALTFIEKMIDENRETIGGVNWAFLKGMLKS